MGARPAPVTVWNLAVERHRLLGPEASQQLDLLGGALAAIAEILSERLVFDGVPANADAETKPTTAEQVDLGGLFGDQRGLALRQYDHPGDQFQRSRDRGKKAEHDERFVERGVHVVRAVPALVNLRVGADDVVIDEDVAVSELLHPLGVGAHGPRVSAELRLRERHSNSHVVILPAWPSQRNDIACASTIPQTSWLHDR